MKTGIIYKAECMVNGKVYIGKTTRGLNKRRSNHKNSSFNKNNNDYDVHFHRAIRKHTWNAFKWEILEVDVPEDELNTLEELYVTKFDSFKGWGYNMTPGGDGGGAITGKDHHAYDHTLYNFYHQSGKEELNITQRDFGTKYDIASSHVSNLINKKRGSKRAQGWVTDKRNLMITYSFSHSDGRIIDNATSEQFRQISGQTSQCSSRLINGDRKTFKGWRLING